jgi:YHS domain-containing protein
MNKDPVCGMSVDPKSAATTSTHQGKQYSFCSQTCKETFDKNPQRYAQSAAQSGKENPQPVKTH